VVEVTLCNEGGAVRGNGRSDEVGVVQHGAGSKESEVFTGGSGCGDWFDSLGCNGCRSSWVHRELNV
jgi:hypothetical protein